MTSKLLAGALPVFALGSLMAATAAKAEDKPDIGVPDESIAADLPFDSVRASLAASGVKYGVNYNGEYYDVTSGGLSRGSTYNGLIETYVDLDLEKIMGWKGATIHANAFYVHGDGPTAKTGSIFAVSNLEGFETVRLDELWLEQSLLDDKVKVKVGSIAADTMFFISDTAAVFLNGTFGWPGILASNTIQGGPGYPLTSMGAVVTFTPNDKLTLMGAVFNGSPADPFAEDPQKDNPHGTDFRFGDGELMILEGAYKYNIGLEGTVKFGGWKQFNAPEGVYSDFRSGNGVNNDYGIYGIIDQQIWKGDGDKTITAFGRISGSPTDRSPMDFYFDTGVLFAGFVPGRAKDTFGAAYGYGQISSDLVDTDPSELKTFESVLELNYVAQIANGITLAPDFQYFWNPGAVAEVDHAAVWGSRLKISY
ncbi:carbohydrate porin [Hyphomicrobium sp.]|jgi:porin|uniref:carbohydrate porin n=1 Tax=Hyphomicrobium sp. TaxID=82 RepID=UPI0035640B9A